jgi:L-histidine N-alpha-methyltransferase
LNDFINNTTALFSHKVYGDELEIYRFSTEEKADNFAEDVRKGLTAKSKYLLPKYFYDEKGSKLFEKICSTKEYYVTRTEAEILKRHSDEIVSANCNKKLLVELGSGSSVKTKYVIDSLIKAKGEIHYMPIDVSDIIISSSEKLIDKTAGLKVSGFISEYEKGLSYISENYDEPKLIMFLGSSIGNFDFLHSVKFVSFIRSKMKKNDSLLIGFDMKKDVNILNAAYNDKAGYTAEFNLNLLRRINTELCGNFDLSIFEHRAYFNEKHSRIEMHLVSLEEQDVLIESIGEPIHFKKGEDIYTENSYKFTRDMISDIGWFSNLKLTNIWQDEKRYFSLCLFEPM